MLSSSASSNCLMPLHTLLKMDHDLRRLMYIPWIKCIDFLLGSHGRGEHKDTAVCHRAAPACPGAVLWGTAQPPAAQHHQMQNPPCLCPAGWGSRARQCPPCWECSQELLQSALSAPGSILLPVLALPGSAGATQRPVPVQGQPSPRQGTRRVCVPAELLGLGWGLCTAKAARGVRTSPTKTPGPVPADG